MRGSADARSIAGGPRAGGWTRAGGGCGPVRGCGRVRTGAGAGDARLRVIGGRAIRSASGGESRRPDRRARGRAGNRLLVVSVPGIRLLRAVAVPGEPEYVAGTTAIG